MNKLLLLLMIVPMIGFGQNNQEKEEISKKGNWSTSDMDQCKKDGVETMAPVKEYLFSKYGITLKELTDCNCGKLEKILESYNIYKQLTPDDLRKDYDYDWRDCLEK
jgi:hypothetical protein